MKVKSERGGEHPTLWIRRKEAFDNMVEPIWNARQKYRDALTLKGSGDDPWSKDPGMGKKRANYSNRYLRWLKAQGTGEDPVIKTDRNADDDELMGEMVDLVMGRVLFEGRAMDEWRDTYADKCWLGCSAVWYGFHADVVTVEEAYGAAEGAGDRADRAAQGDLEPNPGQDHVAAAAGLRAIVDEKGAEIGANVRQALINAAQAHDRAVVKEQEAGEDVRIAKRKIWFKRGVPGVDTFWDSFATSIEDAEWMAQRVLMRVEDAKKYKGFSAGARSRLKGQPIGKTNQKDGREVVDGDGIPGAENEANRVVIYIFWDKRYKTRHFICPDLPGEYLENDETNPYVDANGEDLIPDFFPCAYSAPELAPVEGAERTLGFPLIASGWAQENDADQFAEMMVSDAKKQSNRHYVLNRQLIKNPDEVALALESGKSSLVIQVDVPPEHMDKVIVPLAFRGSTGEVSGQAAWAEQQWVKNQAMPHAELSSRPQAGTATQEEIGVAAGRNEAEDIIKADERAFARMCYGVRGLIRGFYNDEKILALLGPSWIEKFKAWDQSALDGDSMDIRFGVRALHQENVKVNMSMKYFELAQNYTGPMGLPIKDLRPIIEEIGRGLGMGTPKDVAPEVMQMRQLVEQLVQQIDQLTEENQALAKEAKSQDSSTQKRGPKKKRRSGGSSRSTSSSLTSAARRGSDSA